MMGVGTVKGTLHIKLSEVSECSMHWPKLSHNSEGKKLP